MTTIDNRLGNVKKPIDRVFNDIFTQKMGDETKKHRTKVLALSIGILFIQFANVDLVQLAFIKFTSASSSPLPLLILALVYFFFYFSVGSVLDYRKFQARNTFASWEANELSIGYIQTKLESGEYFEHPHFQGHIDEWIKKFELDHSQVNRLGILEMSFYWVGEVGIPVLATLIVVVKLFY